MNDAYEAYHAPRYAFLLDLLRGLGIGSNTRILDLGPSRLTSMLRQKFGVVDTMGFGPDSTHPDGNHFECDLNLTQHESSRRRGLPQYDVIIMAEVIEHLYTAPEIVLSYLRTLMRAKGILVLQTPNAASLQKRIKLLLGRNPYERIRPDNSDPGHFRESTAAELKQFLKSAGFTVENIYMAFYFDARFAHHEEGRTFEQPLFGRLKNMVYRVLPPSLREGITIVARAA